MSEKIVTWQSKWPLKKYRGLSLEKLWKTDRAYVRWAMSSAELPESRFMRDRVKAAMAENPALVSQIIEKEQKLSRGTIE